MLVGLLCLALTYLFGYVSVADCNLNIDEVRLSQISVIEI